MLVVQGGDVLDLRLAISAFIRPVLNIAIGAVTLWINYFGLKIIAAHFGFDIDYLFVDRRFLFAASAGLIVLFFRHSAIDRLIDLLDKIVGANFAIGLVMIPYLAYLFWPTMGWRFLLCWFVGLVWLAIDMFLTVIA